MSYTREREQFIETMTRHGLPLDTTRALLRAATTLQRLAELACSSEAADRDRIPCPAIRRYVFRNGDGTKRIVVSKTGKPCICDRPNDGHEDIPRIALQDWQATQRAEKTVPAGWRVITQGDPRGYVLRVIPPTYAERNTGRDVHNLDSIGVPSGPTRLHF